MIDPQMLERIGAFTDPMDGQLKRYRVRNANFEWDPEDPKAELNGALLAYDQQQIPHPVILPLATDPASLREAQLKAINAGADFYHPQWGWLRWGKKREVERPENLGASTVRYTSTRVAVAPLQVSGVRFQVSGDEVADPPIPDTQDPEDDQAAPHAPTPETRNPKPETQRDTPKGAKP